MGTKSRAASGLPGSYSTMPSSLPNSPRWLGKLNYSSPLPWAGLRLGYVVAREFDFDEDLVGQSILLSTLAFFPLLYVYDWALLKFL